MEETDCSAESAARIEGWREKAESLHVRESLQVGASVGVDVAEEAVVDSLAWVLKLNLQPLVEISKLEKATLEET